MTCIVAVRDNNGILLGADGLSSNGSYKTSPTSSKIFTIENVAVGFTWSHRVTQVCRRAGLIKNHDRSYDENWAIDLSEHWAQALRDAQAIEITNSMHGKDIGSMCIVACPGGRIWEISGEGCVLEDSRGYTATGSGYSPAMGSLYSTYGLPTRDRVMTALYAATELVPSVGPPYSLARVTMDGVISIENNIC